MHKNSLAVHKYSHYCNKHVKKDNGTNIIPENAAIVWGSLRSGEVDVEAENFRAIALGHARRSSANNHYSYYLKLYNIPRSLLRIG